MDTIGEPEQTGQHVNPSRPASKAPLTPLAYRNEPMGEVVASDAAFAALRKSRLWALVFAIALFVYGTIGLVMGTIWLVVMITKRGELGAKIWQFIVLSTGNLLFAPIALLGGVLALRYISAAARAYNRRDSEDLERALIRQQHIWRWAAAAVLAVIGFPFAVLFVAACMNLWP